jgi:hypothetical protein
MYNTCRHFNGQMRVEGYDNLTSYFDLLYDYEGEEVDRPTVDEYVIINRSTDLKGLRILLINNAFSDKFRIIENGNTYTILEWIDANVNETSVIHDFMRSGYFSILEFEGSNLVPVLTDNQLLFYLKHMIHNIQEHGVLLQRADECYRHQDDERIFTHYQLMLEDLREISVRAYLEIDFNRDHILREIESRPDYSFLQSDY